MSFRDRREHLLSLIRGLVLREADLCAALAPLYEQGARADQDTLERIARLRDELRDTERAHAEMAAEVERLDGLTLDREACA